MEVEFEYKPEDFERLTWFLRENTHDPIYRRYDYQLVLITLVLGLLVAYIMNALNGWQVRLEPHTWVMLILVATAVVTLLYVPMLSFLAARRRRFVQFMSKPAQAVSISESGLFWSGGVDNPGRMPWKSVKEFAEDRHGIYVVFDTQSGVSTGVDLLPWRMIPKRAFPSDQAAIAFYETGRHNIMSVEMGRSSRSRFRSTPRCGRRLRGGDDQSRKRVQLLVYDARESQ